MSLEFKGFIVVKKIMRKSKKENCFFTVKNLDLEV